MSDTMTPCQHCGKPLPPEAKFCDQCGCTTKRDKPQRIKPLAAVGIALVTILMVVGFLSEDAKPVASANGSTSSSADASKAQAPAQPAAPPPLFSAEQIAAAYAENTVAADQALKGKRFRVQGVVADIATDFMGDPYLMLRGGQNEFMEPHFGFGKDDIQALAQLRKGDQVTLECTGRGDVAKTPMSDTCRLL